MASLFSFASVEIESIFDIFPYFLSLEFNKIISKGFFEFWIDTKVQKMKYEAILK